MTKTQRRHRLPSRIGLTLLACIAGSAAAAETSVDDVVADDPGVRVAPKPNNTYVVDGETVTFVDLENRLTVKKPSRIVIEFSRQTKSASCAIMLGIELAVPIWTRSYNGRMKRLQIDAKSDDLKTIERCR
jgi:hypothetical protein